MIYFNIDGALGAPKAILADGNLTAITTDIALAVAQVYHNFNDPITKELFKLWISKVFSADSFIWEKGSKNGSRVQPDGPLQQGRARPATGGA